MTHKHNLNDWLVEFDIPAAAGQPDPAFEVFFQEPRNGIQEKVSAQNTKQQLEAAA